MFRSRKLDLLVLVLVCVGTMWWGLGKFGLTDPDEPFYAQTVREMLARHEWVTPVMYGQPNFEKPIIFYWLAMLTTKVFGENEFGSRAPSALAGTLTVLLIYFVVTRVFNRRAGFLAGLVLATGGRLATRMDRDAGSIFILVVAFLANFWLRLPLLGILLVLGPLSIGLAWRRLRREQRTQGGAP